MSRLAGARRAARRVLVAGCLCAVACPATAQQIGTAVLPDDITVGDVFQAVVRVEAAGPAGVAFPDTLVLPGDLEMAGRRRIVRDTVAGRERWTAVYPLTGWRPGEHALPEAVIQLVDGERVRTARAQFPAVRIRSVLPADTAGIQPKPPHDVLGANRVWWPILLGALLLLVLVALLIWWRRRRRNPEPIPTVPIIRVPPREAALAALERLRTSGAIEQGAFRPFYIELGAVLRTFVADVEPLLSPDLTTTELHERTGAVGRAAETRELIEVLHAADLVKFARRSASAEEAVAHWERARRFVQAFDPRPVERRAA